MSQEPERKKRRFNNNINPFVDVEESNASDDESSERETESNTEVHEEDMMVDCVTSHRKLLLRVEDLNQESGQDWDAFLERALNRGGRTRDFGYDMSPYLLTESDLLWEMPCMVGREETVAFDLLHASLHDTKFPPILAVIGRPSIPGRVFIETRCDVDLRVLSSYSRFLVPRPARQVPLDGRFRVFAFSYEGVSEGSWVRIRDSRKKWSRYNGDIGYMTSRDGKSMVALVPRSLQERSLEETRSLHARPLASPLTVAKLTSLSLGGMVRFLSDGCFVFRAGTYTPNGFLLVEADKITFFSGPTTLPLVDELSVFESGGLIHSSRASLTRSSIDSIRIKIHDRVRIVSGDYLGLSGTVVSVRDMEAVVRVHAFGVDDSILLSSLRTHFVVGDQVMVLDGANNGVGYWVMHVSDRSLWLSKFPFTDEIEVDALRVRFYDPLSSSLPLIPRNVTRLNMGRDPNAIYIGLYVVVVHATTYKGYRGLIKSTSIDGRAFVELEACQQRIHRFKLNELSIHDRSQDIFSTSSAVRLSPQPLFLDLPSVRHDEQHIDAVDTTLAFPPDVVDAVEDDSQFIIPWLIEPAFSNLRVKLYLRPENDAVVEAVHASESELRIRMGMSTRKVPWRSVRLVPPSTIGGFVAVVSGSSKGQVFKLRSITDGVCVVRRNGYRPRKNEADPVFNLDDLVSIFPT